MVMYAMRGNRGPTPARAAMGCPNTGWVHEAQPPWRVITSTNPDHLPLGHGADPDMWVAEYTGDEATVDVVDWFPEMERRLLAVYNAAEYLDPVRVE